MNTNLRQTELAGFKAATQQCRFSGCYTLTVQTYCAKHRPQSAWAIAEQVRAELHRKEGCDGQ